MKKNLLTVLCIALLAPAFAGQELNTEAATHMELDSALNRLRVAQQKNEALEAAAKESAEKIARLEAENKRLRRLPVKVSRRKSLTGSGVVYEFHNTSGGVLPLKVTIQSATFGPKEFDLILPAPMPAPAKEIGKMQGWDGLPGDIITIESAGYDSAKIGSE